MPAAAMRWPVPLRSKETALRGQQPQLLRLPPESWHWRVTEPRAPALKRCDTIKTAASLRKAVAGTVAAGNEKTVPRRGGVHLVLQRLELVRVGKIDIAVALLDRALRRPGKGRVRSRDRSGDGSSGKKCNCAHCSPSLTICTKTGSTPPPLLYRPQKRGGLVVL